MSAYDPHPQPLALRDINRRARRLTHYRAPWWRQVQVWATYACGNKELSRLAWAATLRRND